MERWKFLSQAMYQMQKSQKIKLASQATNDQVQEDQAALSSTEVVPENKKAGHQLENDNLSSDEPHQSYSVETRKAWRTLESTLA